MKQGKLLNECINQKKKFLVYLRQGLESLNPDIYESSIQILAEMIDKGHVIMNLILLFAGYRRGNQDLESRSECLFIINPSL